MRRRTGSAACSSAARMRSSGTTMLPCTSVAAWKMPELGRVAPPRAVDAVAGLLGDLVAQVRPAAQRGGQARTRALGALPRVLGPVEVRPGGLLGPVEGRASAQHVACRPLDVGAQRTGRRVHEKYTAGDRTCHVVLLNGLRGSSSPTTSVAVQASTRSRGVLVTACTTAWSNASLTREPQSWSRMVRMAFLRTDRSRRSR